MLRLSCGLSCPPFCSECSFSSTTASTPPTSRPCVLTCSAVTGCNHSTVVLLTSHLCAAEIRRGVTEGDPTGVWMAEKRGGLATAYSTTQRVTDQTVQRLQPLGRDAAGEEARGVRRGMAACLSQTTVSLIGASSAAVPCAAV